MYALQALESSNYQVLTAFSNTLHTLQPQRLPGFAFAWLELVSHRMFMPKLLLAPNQKGWPLFQRFLIGAPPPHTYTHTHTTWTILEQDGPNHLVL